MAHPIERKLAAILSADAVNSKRVPRVHRFADATSELCLPHVL